MILTKELISKINNLANIGNKILYIGDRFFIYTKFNPPTTTVLKSDLKGQDITDFILGSVFGGHAPNNVIQTNLDNFLSTAPTLIREYHKDIEWQIWVGT